MSSCAKKLGETPEIVRDLQKDMYPLSNNQVAVNLAIVLCYLRITMVTSMSLYGNASTTIFICTFLLSLFLDTLGREVMSRADRLNFLQLGLSTLCDILFIIVSYLGMMHVLKESSMDISLSRDANIMIDDSMKISGSYIDFMKTFYFSIGSIFDSNMILSLVPVFLCVDIMAYISHIFNMYNRETLKYVDLYTEYRMVYPVVLTIMEIGQCWFILKFYMLTHTDSYNAASSIHHNFALCSFLFMRGLNATVLVTSIRLWSKFEDSDTDSIMPEVDDIDLDICDILSNPDPEFALRSNMPPSNPPSVDNHSQQMSSSVTLKSKIKSSKSSPTIKNISPSINSHPNEHHHHLHKGESHIQSDYSLRDGSSLSHNPHNQYVVHNETPAAKSSKKRTSKHADSDVPKEKSSSKTLTPASKSVDYVETSSASHHHLHKGESYIQSDYSLRDGSSLSHNPQNQYVVRDELHEDVVSGKKRKTVSIMEQPAKTPRKSPSNIKNRKKTPAKVK